MNTIVVLTLLKIHKGGNVMERQRLKQPYNRSTKSLPRVIPEEVLSQLHKCLPSLPPPIRRMTHLLLETGMRVREVCALPFDCLIQDSSGGYVRYLDSKVQKEKVFPLSTEVVEMLQEQRRVVKQEQGEKTIPEYLFLDANSRPFLAKTFLDMLNLMAKEREILDNAGNVWRFRVHHFRHTFGRQLLVNNASSDAITRFFGHCSLPATPMLNTYTRIGCIDDKYKNND